MHADPHSHTAPTRSVFLAVSPRVAVNPQGDACARRAIFENYPLYGFQEKYEKL